jgi:homoserine acetyltransferase
MNETIMNYPMIESIKDLHLAVHQEDITTEEILDVYDINYLDTTTLNQIKDNLIMLHHAMMTKTVGAFIVEL